VQKIAAESSVWSGAVPPAEATTMTIDDSDAISWLLTFCSLNPQPSTLNPQPSTLNPSPQAQPSSSNTTPPHTMAIATCRAVQASSTLIFSTLHCCPCYSTTPHRLPA
jgi:hypothetical protein